MKRLCIGLAVSSLFAWMIAGCAAAQPARPSGAASGTIRVLAAETFLADIAQNVAGERIKVDSLLPIGADPHSFEPTPLDIARVAESQVVIINGAGFEAWFAEVLANAGGQRQVIEASAGLQSREMAEGDPGAEDEHGEEGDPHFWFDPNLVIRYVENIRDGLVQADPQGRTIYERNAQSYIGELQALDAWIKTQVDEVPVEQRKMVTDHESFGYFADRYGFEIVGAIVPGVSSGASPSAQQMTALIEQIKSTGTSAIFLEIGTNPELAQVIAQETGAEVITGLYTHSITEPGGEAPTYIEMMKYNVRAIMDALK